MEAVHSLKIESLQVLRAVAALLVVASHISIQLYGSYGSALPNFFLWLRDFGSTGVDIFFVISGFIMLYSTRSLSESKWSVGVFFMRRLIRIVPLYWFATAFLLVLWESGILHKTVHRPIFDIVGSFFFLPVFNGEGNLRPLLGVGWTLVYEMFFYLIFGFALFVRQENRFRLTLIVMFAFTACGILFPPRPQTSYWVYTSPLLLEFVLGVWIAHLFLLNQRKLSLAVSIFIHVASWIALAASASDHDRIERLIYLGIPAALIVWSALQVERSFGGWGRIPVFSQLGDSSYSMYLLHPIILIGFAFVSRRLDLPETISAVSAFIFMLLAIATMANLAYLALEKPLTIWLNERLLGKASISNGKKDSARPNEAVRRL